MNRFLFALLLGFLTGCSGQSRNDDADRHPACVMDSSMNTEVGCILRAQMDSIGATAGQIIVLHTPTGQIKTMCAFKKTGNKWTETRCTGNQHMSSLMRLVSVLACLVTEKVKLCRHVT